MDSSPPHVFSILDPQKYKVKGLFSLIYQDVVPRKNTKMFFEEKNTKMLEE
jgi:hypothetical protein